MEPDESLPEWGALAGCVHPSSYGVIMDACEEEGLDPFAVGRALQRAGLYAAPLELVAGSDEPPPEPGQRGPAIVFEEGPEGVRVCAVPGRSSS